MNTQDISALASEVAAIDSTQTTAADHLSKIILALLAECAPSIRREGKRPYLTSTADEGATERADWVGVCFSGGRTRRHSGQGGCTRQWCIGGTGYYVEVDGTVRSVSWDGDDTDFGCAGYLAAYTSTQDETPLAEHLAMNPESAQEIVDALRKLVAEDVRAAKDRAAKMTEIITSLK